MHGLRFCWWVAVLVLIPGPGTAGPGLPRLDLRISSDDWGASRVDIGEVLQSAAREIHIFCPEREVGPVRVEYREGSPMVLFRRSEEGEIRVRISSRQAYWAQYAYQFAHEFCHILCGHDRVQRHYSNKWFEEALCEAASLFALRRMAERWRSDPPYPNWRSFSKALKGYSDEVLSRDERRLPEGIGLGAWYRTNRDALRRSAGLRDKNGVVAGRLLELFERQPSGWGAAGFLNVNISAHDQSLQKYLEAWRSAVPAEQKDFVRQVGLLFELELD